MFDIADFHLNAKKNDCTHKEVEIRKRLLNMGVIQYVRQCLCCGDIVSMSIKKENALLENNGNEPKQFDDSFYNEEKTKRNVILKQRIEEMKKSNAEERELENKENTQQYNETKEEFHTKYNKYLSSNEWKHKRKLVMQRANGVCEACLERKADQVHHITYKHVFDEFLFELVAICNECHRRIHPDKLL